MTRCGLTATNSADKPHYAQGWRMDSFGSVLQFCHIILAEGTEPAGSKRVIIYLMRDFHRLRAMP